MSVKMEELKDLECDNSTYKDEFDFVFAKTTACTAGKEGRKLEGK